MNTKPTASGEMLDLWFERLQMLLDHVQDLVALHRPDGRYVWISKSVTKLLGYTVDELLNKDPYDYFHEADKTRIREESHAAVLAGKESRIRYRYRHKNGHYVWLETLATPVYNGEPDPIALQTHSRNITAEVLREEERNRREQVLARSFDLAPIGKALVGLRGRWLKVNKATCEMLGYTEDELLTMTFQDITHPDDLEMDLALVREMIEGKRTKYRMLKRYIRKDGETVWANLFVSLVYEQSGEPDFFVSQIVDVTDQVQQTAQLEEERLRLKSIFDAAIDVIIVANGRGIVETVNAAIEPVFGYTPEELIGQSINMLMPHPYKSEHDAHMARYEETGRQKVIGAGRRVVGRRKDGTLFPIDLAVTEMQLNGERHFTGIMRDLTLKYERRRELEAAEILYKDIIARAPFAVVVYADGKVLYANDHLIKLLGREDVDPTGMPIEDVFRPHLPAKEDSFTQAIIRADGTRQDVSVMAANIQYEDEPTARVLFLTPAERPSEDAHDARK